MAEQKQNQTDIPGVMRPVALRTAAEATQAFLTALKNYSIFPVEHTSTINLMRGLHASLSSYVNHHGALHLDIERGRVLVDGEVVFEENITENNPAFVFFRDGIFWLEFQEGLSLEEILRFFQVVTRFNGIQEDPEADLVTELWEAEYPHINYGVSDNLWEAEPVLEFSLLNPESPTFSEQKLAGEFPGFDLLKRILGLIPVSPRSIGGEELPEGKVASEDEASGKGGNRQDRTSPSIVDGSGREKLEVDTMEVDASDSSLGEKQGAGLTEKIPAGAGFESTRGGQDEVGESKPQPLKPEEAVPAPKAGKEAEELDFWDTLKKVNLPAESGRVAATAKSRSGLSGRAGGQGSYLETPEQQGDSGETRKRRGGFSSVSPVSSGNRAVSRPGRGQDWELDNASENEEFIGVDVTLIEPGHSLWGYSQEEHDLLQQMVRDYEEKDNSADIIELLLILLQMEEEPQIVIAIAGFLKEEFRISLTNRNFKVAHDLLVNMKSLCSQAGQVKEWALPLLDKFNEDIAAPEVLNALAPLWAVLPTLEPGTLANFASLLPLLPPKSGEALVGMSSQVETGKGRQILIDLIAAFAARDLDVLENMLAQPEEDLIMRLIGVLREAPDRDRAELLLLKVIGHAKSKIRKEACDILLERNCEQFDQLFPLIHDPDTTIRLRIFNYFGRERNRGVEQMFLSYMAGPKFLNQEHGHISRCYVALGSSGSDASLPFLKKVLFSQPWNFMVGIGQTVHRQGAAIALYKIHTRTSLRILQEAESSSIPHIRKAWMVATGN